jgi:hypothetical protein
MIRLSEDVDVKIVGLIGGEIARFAASFCIADQAVSKTAYSVMHLMIAWIFT